jgi:hypothetical protein
MTEEITTTVVPETHSLDLKATITPVQETITQANIKPNTQVYIKAIKSDGSSDNTQILLSDGSQIGNISRISWELDNNSIVPIIKMEVMDVSLRYVPSVNTIGKVPVYAIDSPNPKGFIRISPPIWLRKILAWCNSLVNLRHTDNKTFVISDDELLDKIKDIK